MNKLNRLTPLFWYMIILLVGLAPLVGANYVPRNFNFDAQYVQQLAQSDVIHNNDLLRWMARLTNLLGIAIPLLAVVLYRRRVKKLGSGVLALWIGALAFNLGPIVSSIFGTVRAFSVWLFIPPLIFSAVILLRPMPLEWFVGLYKRLILYVYIYGSILAVFLLPRFAVEFNYKQGLLFPVRIHGIASHANTLGPLIVMYLILESHWPSQRFSRVNRFVALGLLLLTQSKTSLVIGLVIVFVEMVYRLWIIGRYRKLIRYGTYLCGACGVSAIFLWFNVSLLSKILGDRLATQIHGLTGRTAVWTFTINTWKHNKLFGFGPNLWDPFMRARFEKFYHWAPPHAHNQLVQTLGESGLFGVAGLITYLFTIILAAKKITKATKFASISLLLLILIRGLTEVPFWDVLMQNEFVMHFAVFSFLVLGLQDTGLMKSSSSSKVLPNISNKVGSLMDEINVLGVGITPMSWTQALGRIVRVIDSRGSEYVCCCTVHTVMETQYNAVYRNSINSAYLKTTDGMPLLWLAKKAGYSQSERIYGPDLMLNLCEISPERGYRHFFYGGAEGVAEQLAKEMQRLYPGLQVAGYYSPPFRALTAEEDELVSQEIRESGANLIWVGLGTPKQDLWMAEHRGKFPGVMFGVGAAFDFHTGRVKQAPVWMRNSGLEWVYRLFAEPRRLWKRYIVYNSLFLLKLAKQKLAGS